MTVFSESRDLHRQVKWNYMQTKDYLVTRRISGEDLTKDLSDPLRIRRIPADALRTRHSHRISGSFPVSDRYARYMESADGDPDGGYYDPSVYTEEYRLSSRQKQNDPGKPGVEVKRNEKKEQKRNKSSLSRRLENQTYARKA